MTVPDALMWTAVVLILLAIVSAIVRHESNDWDDSFIWLIANWVLLLVGVGMIIVSIWMRVTS